MNPLNGLPFPHPRHRPTANEVRLGRTLIQEIDREIKCMEGEAEERRTELEALLRQRANVASYMSPLRCLPTEIPGDIIQLYMDRYTRHTSMMPVCGTIRDVMIGMPTIWSTIQLQDRPVPEGNFKNGFPCGTVQQLSMVLARAGSTPLNLFIEKPIPRRLIKHILSSNCTIGSLEIDGYEHQDDMGLKLLNLSTLRRLTLKSINSKRVEFIMDLALLSNCEGIEVCLSAPCLRGQLVSHPLLDRVTDLTIVTASLESLEPVPVLRPGLKTLRIGGHPPDKRLVECFDLSNLQTLDITVGWFLAFKRSHGFPLFLTKLILRENTLSSQKLGISQPFILPNLTTLQLHNTSVWGPLRNYFQTPRLKNLLMRVRWAWSDGDDEIIKKFDIDIGVPFGITFGTDFFRDIPDLERLVITSTNVDYDLPSRLQACSKLQVFELSRGWMDESTFSLIERLLDAKVSPSLRTLKIACDEWSQKLPRSYTEFVGYWATQRSHLHIFGEIRRG